MIVQIVVINGDKSVQSVPSFLVKLILIIVIIIVIIIIIIIFIRATTDYILVWVFK